MKKIFALLLTLVMALALTACGGEDLPEIPEEVTMDTVDDYLGRGDVQYVDLRNFDDKMKSGYIAGFEFIPFFDYLEATDILVRTDGDWNYAAADLKSEAALKALFDEDKTIFLMCGSGTRAGYVLAALEAAGYENVINVGGIADYAGDNKVDGDGSYNVEVQLPLPTTVDMTNIDMYLGRSDVQYVDLRNFDDKMKSGYIAGFEFIPFFDYLEYSDILVRTDGNWDYASADLVNQSALEGLFDADKAIFLMCGSGTRAGYVKAALEAAGYTNVYNVGGISSYEGDNKVLGDGTYNVEVPAVGDYTPGVYYGYSNGFVALITVGANGAVEDVFLDAAHFTYGTTELLSMKRAYTTPAEYPMNYTTDGTTYTLDTGKLDWWMQADALEAAVLENQGWVSTWTLTDGAFANDEIAGVSIGVENWKTAIEAALTEATPAS